MWTVSKLAARCALSRGTLLYYESIGLLKPPARSAGNYRSYGERDLQRLQQICAYRHAGLTLDDIRAILRRTQFPAHLLELEVTESVLLDQDQRTLETLHKLRAMDIRVTLDDFGTGYSSLSYLRRFPFDKIKIDKSFIQGQGSDRSTKVILEAMIRMCTDLGLDVVVEGVETELQLHELRQLGCREIQGFLLGEPLLPAMIESFLTVHGRRSGTEPLQDAAAANT